MKQTITIIILLFSICLFADEFPIATGSYSQTYPAAIVAEDDYFVAFLDKRGGASSYEFYGKFVEPDGTVAPGENQLVAPHEAMSFMHDITRSDDQFLFVWSRQRGMFQYTRDTYGRLINLDGTPDGPSFQISIGNTISTSFIRVASDGEDYLVIWQEGMPHEDATIRAQYVSSDGTLIGNNFSIRPDALGPDHAQVYPDIVFDGTNYLVIWDDNRTGSRNVYGQFIDPDGNLVGDDFLISDNIGADQYLVRVAYNGMQFLAIWGDGRDDPNNNGIYGQLFDTSGNLIGDNIPIAPSSGGIEKSWPDIGTNGSEFLIAWRQDDYRNDEIRDITGEEDAIYNAVGEEPSRLWYDVYGRRVASDGSLLTDEFVICDAMYHQQDPSIASIDSDYLATWQDSRNANQYYDIYGMIIEGEDLQTGILVGSVSYEGNIGFGEHEVIIQINGMIINPDETGNFSTELPADTYDVTVHHPWYEIWSEEVTVVEDEITTLDILLQPTHGILEGTLVLVGGDGHVQTAIIAAGDEATNPDATGDFELALPDSIYDIDISLEDYHTVEIEDVEITAGEFTTLDDIYLYPIQLEQPINLAVESIDDHALFSWERPQNIPDEIELEYAVYLDDMNDPLAITAETSYQLTGLIHGEVYTAGVSAIYEVGESEIATIEFEYTGTDADEPFITVTELKGNYPNPFNPNTTIKFTLAKDSSVTLKIYNLRGQLIKSLLKKELSAGTHQVRWDGTDLNNKQVTSGIYLYVLDTDDQRMQRKMIMLK